MRISKTSILAAILCLATIATSCEGKSKVPPAGSSVEPTAFWDFSDMTGLEYTYHSPTPSDPSVLLDFASEPGVLKITTRKGTRDRAKVCSLEKYGAGRYEYRIYVPQMGAGDQASIGAFLYCSDRRELDFEIGYGTAARRAEKGAKEDEVLVHITNQANPWFHDYAPIKAERWYTFSIDISVGDDGRYIAAWYVDDDKIGEKALLFGTEVEFRTFCSVENLEFTGDHLAEQDNYGKFDHMSYYISEYYTEQ